MTETKITPNEQVVYRNVGSGGGLLLHLETGAYHGLNPFGAAVWELIDGERSRSEIAADLRARLEHAPPELEAELTAFLDSLRARDLTSE
jgi:Coenzyme PQQ synthesis protein D (PqqD)